MLVVIFQEQLFIHIYVNQAMHNYILGNDSRNDFPKVIGYLENQSRRSPWSSPGLVISEEVLLIPKTMESSRFWDFIFHGHVGKPAAGVSYWSQPDIGSRHELSITGCENSVSIQELQFLLCKMWVIVVHTTHWVVNTQLANGYKRLSTVAGTLFFKIITKLK